MRYRLIISLLIVILAIAGCSRRKDKILLERRALGRITDEPSMAKEVERELDPVFQSKTEDEVEVSVRFASRDYQNSFFNNEDIFGDFAGDSPYYPEHVVFHVSITNGSEDRILIQPNYFVLVDDLGNQYGPIGVAYLLAFAKFRSPITSLTTDALGDVHPRYMGVGVPIGRLVTGKGQRRLALIKQVSIRPGYLYPGVSHDGVIAYWNPATTSKRLRLFLSNIATGFDPNNEATKVLSFVFDFDSKLIKKEESDK
ncbi:MAG: hypothetical protein V3W19_15225 [Desulfatiglandales bacterium]